MQTSIKIKNFNELREKFNKSPETVTEWLNKAIQASIFEILQLTDDSGNGGLFQYKTPRSLRSGYLALSFKQGVKFGKLFGSIGPVAEYAPYVYFGHTLKKGGRVPANPYLDRILKAANPKIQKHFDEAIIEIKKAIT